MDVVANTKQSLEFRGKSGEYFKIWIVNIFLSVITLGIYSPWAKVRRNRYFYSNTFYQNSPFEYTANPLNILKGRVLVFLVYLLFLFSSQVWLNPVASLVIFVFVMLFIPWLINKSIKFKLKNTMYKNVRLRYKEGTFSFYKFFLIHTILNVFTLFLAFPFTYNRFKKLLINSSSYGTTDFSYSGRSRSIYWRYIKIVGWYLIFVFLPLVLLSGLVGTIKSTGLSGDSVPEYLQFLVGLASIGMSVIFLFVGFILAGLYEAYMRNYIWSETTLGDVKFESSLSGWKLARIYLVNILAIIISFGFLTPWAKIRVTKYKCESFTVDAPDLDSFIADESFEHSALGEESEEFFDIDIGV